MAPNERPPQYFSTKGIAMFIDMLIAILCILAVGVAFNYIAHLATK